jgi:peptide/nickel transport system substrate-binding protein
MQAQAKNALLERDTAKRAEMYAELQRKVRETGPFIMLWQETEVAGMRKNVQGLKLGPTFDTNFLAPITK